MILSRNCSRKYFLIFAIHSFILFCFSFFWLKLRPMQIDGGIDVRTLWRPILLRRMPGRRLDSPQEDLLPIAVHSQFLLLKCFVHFQSKKNKNQIHVSRSFYIHFVCIQWCAWFLCEFSQLEWTERYSSRCRRMDGKRWNSSLDTERITGKINTQRHQRLHHGNCE